jgi:hypothetical protein
MMASSLAALRGRGGEALGSDRFRYVVADHTNHQACYDCKTPCLQTWRTRSLAVWSKSRPPRQDETTMSAADADGDFEGERRDSQYKITYNL